MQLLRGRSDGPKLWFRRLWELQQCRIRGRQEQFRTRRGDRGRRVLATEWDAEPQPNNEAIDEPHGHEVSQGWPKLATGRRASRTMWPLLHCGHRKGRCP